MPDATPSFVLSLDTSKEDTPMWLMERLFPNEEDQNRSLEDSIFHLSALSYFSTLAAKRHREPALYVAKWLEKAFKLWLSGTTSIILRDTALYENKPDLLSPSLETLNLNCRCITWVYLTLRVNFTMQSGHRSR